jgi:hypothetical protein
MVTIDINRLDEYFGLLQPDHRARAEAEYFRIIAEINETERRANRRDWWVAWGGFGAFVCVVICGLAAFL